MQAVKEDCSIRSDKSNPSRKLKFWASEFSCRKCFVFHKKQFVFSAERTGSETVHDLDWKNILFLLVFLITPYTPAHTHSHTLTLCWSGGKEQTVIGWQEIGAIKLQSKDLLAGFKTFETNHLSPHQHSCCTQATFCELNFHYVSYMFRL